MLRDELARHPQARRARRLQRGARRPRRARPGAVGGPGAVLGAGARGVPRVPRRPDWRTVSACSSSRPRRSPGGTIGSSRSPRTTACASTTSCCRRRLPRAARRAASTATRARARSLRTTHRCWSNCVTPDRARAVDSARHGLCLPDIPVPVPAADAGGVLRGAARVAQRRAAGREPRVLRVGRGAATWRSSSAPSRSTTRSAARSAARGEARRRKRWLAVGVAGNLAALALFKYANFAVANVNALAPVLAITPLAVAAIPLPLGISFFTFHAISYVVDVYKRNARGRAQPAALRALHPAVPAADRRADHPLARHRRAACRARAAHRGLRATACAASCSASARRC